MRIGQVNQENYKQMLKIIGVKEPKDLNGVFGKGNVKSKGKANGLDQFGQKIGDYSHEAQEARAVKAGLIMEGMMTRPGDDSWRKIVDVPDSIKQKIIDKSREMVIANGNGSISAKQGDEYAKIIKDYLKTIPPSERLSVGWTLEKIGQAERQRIVDYLRTEINWQAGMSFDSRILTESNWGLGKNHMDMKA